MQATCVALAPVIGFAIGLTLASASGSWSDVNAADTPGGGKDKAAKDVAGKPPGGPKGKKQAVEFDGLPEPVRAALKKATDRREFTELSKEEKDGKELFTVKFGEKADGLELKMDANGVLRESRETVGAGKLPPAVAAAIAKAQPGLSNLECKRITTYSENKPNARYEVRGELDGKKGPPLQVGADGTVIQRGKPNKPSE